MVLMKKWLRLSVRASGVLRRRPHKAPAQQVCLLSATTLRGCREAEVTLRVTGADAGRAAQSVLSPSLTPPSPPVAASEQGEAS